MMTVADYRHAKLGSVRQVEGLRKLMTLDALEDPNLGTTTER